MRKVPVKDVVSRRMKEAGVPSAPELTRRAAAKGHQISDTAVKAILRQGGTEDPGVSTVAAIAAGLDMSPIRLFAEMLGVNPDDPGLMADDFRIAWETFKDMTPTQKRDAAPHVKALMVMFRHVKGQK